MAFLSYPVLIEPNLTLQTQTTIWMLAPVAFAAIVANPGLQIYRGIQAHAKERQRQTMFALVTNPTVDLLWVALAACASILLIVMTNELTQEIAVIPFLWVLLLAI